MAETREDMRPDEIDLDTIITTNPTDMNGLQQIIQSAKKRGTKLSVSPWSVRLLYPQQYEHALDVFKQSGINISDKPYMDEDDVPRGMSVRAAQLSNTVTFRVENILGDTDPKLNMVGLKKAIDNRVALGMVPKISSQTVKMMYPDEPDRASEVMRKAGWIMYDQMPANEILKQVDPQKPPKEAWVSLDPVGAGDGYRLYFSKKAAIDSEKARGIDVPDLYKIPVSRLGEMNVSYESGGPYKFMMRGKKRDIQEILDESGEPYDPLEQKPGPGRYPSPAAILAMQAMPASEKPKNIPQPNPVARRVDEVMEESFDVFRRRMEEGRLRLAQAHGSFDKMRKNYAKQEEMLRKAAEMEGEASESVKEAMGEAMGLGVFGPPSTGILGIMSPGFTKSLADLTSRLEDPKRDGLYKAMDLVMSPAYFLRQPIVGFLGRMSEAGRKEAESARIIQQVEDQAREDLPYESTAREPGRPTVDFHRGRAAAIPELAANVLDTVNGVVSSVGKMFDAETYEYAKLLDFLVPKEVREAYKGEGKSELETRLRNVFESQSFTKLVENIDRGFISPAIKPIGPAMGVGFAKASISFGLVDSMINFANAASWDWDRAQLGMPAGERGYWEQTWKEAKERPFGLMFSGLGLLKKAMTSVGFTEETSAEVEGIFSLLGMHYGMKFISENFTQMGQARKLGRKLEKEDREFGAYARSRGYDPEGKMTDREAADAYVHDTVQAMRKYPEWDNLDPNRQLTDWEMLGLAIHLEDRATMEAVGKLVEKISLVKEKEAPLTESEIKAREDEIEREGQILLEKEEANAAKRREEGEEVPVKEEGLEQGAEGRLPVRNAPGDQKAPGGEEGQKPGLDIIPERIVREPVTAGPKEPAGGRVAQAIKGVSAALEYKYAEHANLIAERFTRGNESPEILEQIQAIEAEQRRMGREAVKDLSDQDLLEVMTRENRDLAKSGAAPNEKAGNGSSDYAAIEWNARKSAPPKEVTISHPTEEALEPTRLSPPEGAVDPGAQSTVDTTRRIQAPTPDPETAHFNPEAELAMRGAVKVSQDIIRRKFGTNKQAYKLAKALAKVLNFNLEDVWLGEITPQQLEQWAKEGRFLYDVKSFEDPKWIRDVYKKAESLGYSKNTVSLAVDLIGQMADVFRRNAEYLPLKGGKDKALAKNLDFGFTFDVNKICYRTLNFRKLVRAIEKDAGVPMSPNQLLALGVAMQQKGELSYCQFCYVEAARRAQNQMRRYFVYSTPEDVKQRKMTKDSRAKFLARLEERDIMMRQLGWVKKNGDLDYRKLSKVVSDPAGAIALAERNPPFSQLYKNYLDYINGCNAAKVQPNGRYNHEIYSQFSDDLAHRAVVRGGGLRFFSSTDLDPTQLVDIMQGFIDASILGLPAHCYTKDPYTAMIFGNTGLKINMSIAAHGGGANESMERILVPPDQIVQEITSAGTSLPQVAATFTKVDFKRGTRNLDLDGGAHDLGTDYLAGKGVTNLVWDPFTRSTEHNLAVADAVQEKPVDTVTVNNVLNVIKEPENRDAVVRQAAMSMAEEGTAYFLIHEGSEGADRKPGDGIGRETSKGWQNYKKAKEYIPEIEKHFGEVVRHGNLIEARKPKTRPKNAGLGMIEDIGAWMRWDVAKDLRQKYPNAGTIFVAKNTKQLEWALEQDWIDYIIPLHNAYWMKEQVEAYSLEDFTKVQAEKWVNTKKNGPSPKKKYGQKLVFTGFLIDAKNNEKLAVKNYLAFCDKNGIQPKFSQWRNSPGYAKLLKEYSRTDSPQEPLRLHDEEGRPLLNSGRAKEYVDRYVRGKMLRQIQDPNKAETRKFSDSIEEIRSRFVDLVKTGKDIKADELKEQNSLYLSALRRGDIDFSLVPKKEDLGLYSAEIPFASEMDAVSEPPVLNARDALGGRVDLPLVAESGIQFVEKTSGLGKKPRVRVQIRPDANAAAGRGKAWDILREELEAEFDKVLAGGKPDPDVKNVLFRDMEFGREQAKRYRGDYESLAVMVPLKNLVDFAAMRGVVPEGGTKGVRFDQVVKWEKTDAKGNVVESGKGGASENLDGTEMWTVVKPESLEAITERKMRTPAEGTPEADESKVNLLAESLHGRVRAAVEFLDGMNAVLYGFKDADFASLVHEIVHIGRRRMLNREMSDEARGGITTEDIQAVEDWLGVEDGVWKRHHEELFTKAFMQWMDTGEAPSSVVRKIFQKIVQLISSIRDTFLEEKIDLPDNVKEVFQKMTKEPKGAAEELEAGGELASKQPGKPAGPPLGNKPITPSGPERESVRERQLREAAEKAKATKVTEGREASGAPKEGLKLPELHRLIRELRGEDPQAIRGIDSFLRFLETMPKPTWLGFFSPRAKGGKISIKRELLENPDRAAEVVAHEIGHWVNWLNLHGGPRTLKGTLIQRIAETFKEFRTILPEYPGAPKLSKSDYARLREITKNEMQLIREELKKDVETVRGKRQELVESIAKYMTESQDMPPELKAYLGTMNSKQLYGLALAVLKNSRLPRWFRFKELVGEDPSFKRIFNNLLEQEVTNYKMFRESTLFKELQELHQALEPYDRDLDPAFAAYAEHPSEMYAQLVGALLTNPEAVRKYAPDAYQAFVNWTPQAKPEFWRIWNRLASETPEERSAGRLEVVHNFDRYEDLQKRLRVIKELAETHAGRGAFSAIKTYGWDTHGALYEYLWSRVKDDGKKRSIHIFSRIRNIMERISYGDAPHYAWLRDVEKIFKNTAWPLAKAGNPITGQELSEYFALVRMSLEEYYRPKPKLDPATGDPIVDSATGEPVMEKVEAQIPEPGLLLKDFAREEWERFDQRVGPEKAKALEEIHQKFQDAWQKWIVDAVKKSRMYAADSPLLQKMESNNSYARFTPLWVIEEMARNFGSLDFVDPTTVRKLLEPIMARTGSTDDLADVFTETIKMGTTLLRAAEFNEAKREYVKALEDLDPKLVVRGNVVPAGQQLPKNIPKTETPLPGYERMRYLEEGIVHEAFVPKVAAEQFNLAPMEYGVYARILSKMSSGVKQMLTGKNPAWALFNAFRDFFSSSMKLPGATRILPIKLLDVQKGADGKWRVRPRLVKPLIAYLPKAMAAAAREVWKGDMPDEIVDLLVNMRAVGHERLWAAEPVVNDFSIFGGYREFPEKYRKELESYVTGQKGLDQLAIPRRMKRKLGEMTELQRFTRQFQVDLRLRPEELDRTFYGPLTGVVEFGKKWLIDGFVEKGLSGVGAWTERFGKLISAEYMKDYGEQIYADYTPEERRAITEHVVRTRGGSPDFRARGLLYGLTNNLLLFSNAGVQGWRAHYEVMRENPAEYFKKVFFYDILPTVAAYLLANPNPITDDEESVAEDKFSWLPEMRQNIRKAGKYYLSHFQVIPWYQVIPSGKLRFLTLPRSFEGEFWSVAVYEMLAAAQGRQEFSAALGSIMGQLPQFSLNPIVKMPYDFFQYGINRQQVFDSFRGQPIIPQLDFDAAKDNKAIYFKNFKYLAAHYANTFFGGYIPRINAGEEGAAEQDFLELVANDVPLLGNVLRRLVRTSDSGEGEYIKGWLGKVEGEKKTAAVQRNNMASQFLDTLRPDGGGLPVVNKVDIKLLHQDMVDAGIAPNNISDTLDLTRRLVYFRSENRWLKGLIKAESLGTQVEYLNKIVPWWGAGTVNKANYKRRRRDLEATDGFLGYSLPMSAN